MKLIGTRREFLRASAAAAGSSLLLSGCLHGAATKSEPATGDEAAAKNKESSEMGGEVTATEDLMREHGVLRRALLIYTATATKLREDHVAFPAVPLRKTATLFRDFGEEYHEKKLEEAYIFPAVKKAGGLAAVYADILLVQHVQRVTDQSGQIGRRQGQHCRTPVLRYPRNPNSYGAKSQSRRFRNCAKSSRH